MRDGLEQRAIHRWERNRRFLYRWSSDGSDSGGGRKSGKRALASHDPIAEENHRHVAHVALKEEGKGEENREENELSIDVLFVVYCLLKKQNRARFVDRWTQSLFLFRSVPLPFGLLREEVQSDSIG